MRPIEFIVAVAIGRGRPLLRRRRCWRSGTATRRCAFLERERAARSWPGGDCSCSQGRHAWARSAGRRSWQRRAPGHDSQPARSHCIIKRLRYTPMNPRFRSSSRSATRRPTSRQLYRELTAALDAFGRPTRSSSIDDGSTDETFELLAELQAQDPAAPRDPVPPQLRPDRGVRRRLRARARPLHRDLRRRPPERSGATSRAMIETARARTLDIVCGWRKDRKDAFISRRLPSMIANWIISCATGVQLHDYGCSLKVFRAEVVKPMKLYGEMHRFLPAIASEQGVDDRRAGREPPRARCTARRSTASRAPSAWSSIC